ncbi:hypothetical protein D6817_04620 [Candidatus Pacearchaeota archaeon]|nr:MAG: hypothetical protein D6817_04620 [Candidatus Pacearchaeota archaeon]
MKPASLPSNLRSTQRACAGFSRDFAIASVSKTNLMFAYIRTYIQLIYSLTLASLPRRALPITRKI